ncbi:hypothetical protein HK098_000475 [Nowakowskiella sp. JEL0407]|nr:hypothetical protein HK098_000475 [Nowakowskiella sp. JEL0407]
MSSNHPLRELQFALCSNLNPDKSIVQGAIRTILNSRFSASYPKTNESVSSIKHEKHANSISEEKKAITVQPKRCIRLNSRDEVITKKEHLVMFKEFISNNKYDVDLDRPTTANRFIPPDFFAFNRTRSHDNKCEQKPLDVKPAVSYFTDPVDVGRVIQQIKSVDLKPEEKFNTSIVIAPKSHVPRDLTNSRIKIGSDRIPPLERVKLFSFKAEPRNENIKLSDENNTQPTNKNVLIAQSDESQSVTIAEPEVSSTVENNVNGSAEFSKNTTRSALKRKFKRPISVIDDWRKKNCVRTDPEPETLPQTFSTSPVISNPKKRKHVVEKQEYIKE